MLPGLKQASPSQPFAFPPWSGFASPALICDQRATGMKIGCGKPCAAISGSWKSHPPKAFSLRRRWAALAARMRCRLRSSRYHYYIKTTPLLRLHLISQLSLTASPPRGSLLVGRIFRQLPITAGQQTAQLDAGAGEARPRGKYSRERMALAPIRARRIFPAPRVASDPFQFLSN